MITKKKLKVYASKSDLMNIKIKVGNEVFEFNLYEEVKINENLINKDLLSQPSAYSFLTLLHKKLIKHSKELDQERKKLAAKLYLKYKNPTIGQRGFSDDVCKAKVEVNKKYQKLLSKALEAEHNKEVIEACVNAFEQRKDLIQSISANLRKEK